MSHLIKRLSFKSTFEKWPEFGDFIRLSHIDLIIVVIHYYMGYRRTLSKSFNECKTVLYENSYHEREKI